MSKFLVESIGKTYINKRKYMLNKHKFYKMALVSATMILMLGNIVGAKPYNYDDRTCGCGVTLIIDPCTQSVDLLKFPACGCDFGY